MSSHMQPMTLVFPAVRLLTRNFHTPFGGRPANAAIIGLSGV